MRKLLEKISYVKNSFTNLSQAVSYFLVIFLIGSWKMTQGSKVFFPEFIKSLRKVMAYAMIFSLLWQNCLWATGPYRVLDEDLVGPEARVYGSQRIGIVDSGPIKDNAIHNVFEDFQILEGSGVVFQGNPQADLIYNRVYSKKPTRLSGAIETDTNVPMVFANPRGIILENPDFKGICDLSLTAGHVAQTNKGMVCGIDQGNVDLTRTVIEEQNDLKSVSLAGRHIHVQQSLLSPTDAITLTAGQHLKDLESGEEGLFSPQNADASSHQTSIILDQSTILRSRGIFLTSYEEGASIYANGLLQSTQEDIVIRAMGDIYIDKLMAQRNLDIETTGNVFFKDQALVGGTTRIKANNINIDKDFSAAGQLFLEAYQQVSLKGDVKTKESLDITGQGLTVIGDVSAQKGSLFNLETFTNKGLFSSFGTGLQGTIGTVTNEGKIDLSTLNATFKKTLYEKGGVVRTLGHSVLQGTQYTNKGTVFTCGVHQATFDGSYKDSGAFYSPTLLLLKANSVEYLGQHTSYLKDGVVMASKLTADDDVKLHLKSGGGKSFLQLTSNGNLYYNGDIIQKSSAASRFPLMDYVKIFDPQRSVTFDEDFAKEVATLPLGPWAHMRRSLGSGITLRANGDIRCHNATIDPESGDVNLIAGKITTENTKLKAGFFKGNNASIRGKNAILNSTTLESFFGTASVIAEHLAELNKSHVLGGQHAAVHAKFAKLDSSTVQSERGVASVHGKKEATLTRSFVGGGQSTAVVTRAFLI
ncbi:MAG: hypothetical protein BGO67_05060 [Alphaproteobacteria bacterium 41-28]|nr:MAG: hypothetical protein BGO67_05060 [Alphaproteobacteria bacterium 41-28]